MKTESLFNRTVQLGFGSAILILLVVGGISYRGMVASTETDRWVRHTHAVLEKLQDLLFAQESIESSDRGFVLTGDESYIESYHTAIIRAEQDEANVRNLTVDNPEQQRRLVVLDRLSAEKIQFAETIIGLRRNKGLEAAASVSRSGEGRRNMDKLQAVVHDLQDQELRLLALRDADASRRLRQTKTVLILGTVLWDPLESTCRHASLSIL